MKILIWDMFKLADSGGPSGYVFNVHKHLVQNPNPHISFLSDLLIDNKLKNNNIIIDNNSESTIKKDITPYKKIWRLILSTLNKNSDIKSFLTKFFDYTYRIYHIKWETLKNIDLSGYDYVHFHFLIHLQQFNNTFPDYAGKTILTTHSPCPWTTSMIKKKRLNTLRTTLN